MVLSMMRGTGFLNNRDGITYKKVFATYTHIHALGVPIWAESMVLNSVEYREGKKKRGSPDLIFG